LRHPITTATVSISCIPNKDNRHDTTIVYSIAYGPQDSSQRHYQLEFVHYRKRDLPGWTRLSLQLRLGYHGTSLDAYTSYDATSFLTQSVGLTQVTNIARIKEN